MPTLEEFKSNPKYKALEPHQKRMAIQALFTIQALTPFSVDRGGGGGLELGAGEAGKEGFSERAREDCEAGGDDCGGGGGVPDGGGAFLERLGPKDARGGAPGRRAVHRPVGGRADRHRHPGDDRRRR